jgi:DNA-directed RNA polymerase specialized sigma subunit
MNTRRDYIKEALELIQLAKEEIAKSEVPLSKTMVRRIVKLQRTVVELRNTAIKLHRAQEWTLKEIGTAFEISPSRVSQICRNKSIFKTKRISTRSSIQDSDK